MRTGKLRDRIIIQTYTDSISANGETTKTWTTFATVFSGRVAISGREYLRSDKIKGEVSHIFKIRYLDGILNKMRISHNSKLYQIKAILPDPKDAIFLNLIVNEQSE